MASIVLIIVLSYLAGAIPTSIIAGRLLKGIDIREHGSGNAGATNAVRVMGWKIGAGVLLIDIAKGFVATYYLSQLSVGPVPVDVSVLQIFAGLIAVVGHIWSVFARFKGGKGVATAAGMCLGIAPVTILIALIVFAAVAGTTRYVSLGSILSALTFTTILLVRKYGTGHDVPDAHIFFALFLTALILYTHRSNIKRLIHGTENKFSKK